jgi:hypothetical protein
MLSPSDCRKQIVSGLSESTKLTAYVVHRLLNGRVSVPEVYGWRTDGEEKLIYMQYRARLWKRPRNR